MLHGEGGVLGKVFTRSNKSTSAYCKNDVAELFRLLSWESLVLG
jgi:hypothetical protein